MQSLPLLSMYLLGNNKEEGQVLIFRENSMWVCPCKTYYALVLSMQIEGWIRLKHFLYTAVL